ncbi:MAG: imidazole glycerol phosphate synthase subunit HisH [Actinomycetota bacterium]|jgi:glutamine amidotransferase
MIAILKYNSGNTMSVQIALRRLGHESVVTSDPEMLMKADRVIIPGVGEARSAMSHLRERGLDSLILSLKQPVLGICLGLQLMCRRSEENDTECLGIFDAVIRRFPPDERVPHMGWNNFESLSRTQLLKGLGTDDDLYYVHSYYAEPNSDTTAVCRYILPFSAAMQRDNFHAVQFHPEKSAEAGARLLKNFIEL